MQEDYIEDDFLEEESSSSSRPFLVAVGVLVTLFILMGACTAIFLANNRAAEDNRAEVSARETRNAETEATNIALLAGATDTAAAMPTDTPVPSSTPTGTPEPPTVTPTNTPVVEDTSEEDALAELEDGSDVDGAEDGETGEGTVTDGESDTSDIGDGSDVADGDSTPTPISALSETGDSGNGDALPQTGLDTWGVVIAAFVLVGLFIFARRLRTSG